MSDSERDGPGDDRWGLSGAVAVVTGATRGLGRAMARQLADSGARVVVVGRSTRAQPHRLLPGTLEEVVNDLEGRGANVLPLQADLSRPDDARRVVDDTLAWAGRCDVLVCNASYTPAGTFFDVTPGRWAVGWNITVMSAVVLCQGFLPGMLERRSGRVLAIGSGSAAYQTAPSPDWAPHAEGYGPPLLYPVSKAALERLITGLHDDFGGRGVAFTNLRAGEMTSEAWHLMSGQMGMGGSTEHIQTPDDVAAAAVWLLARDESISGQIVDFHWLQEQGALPVK